jgi:hypothetical protein
VADLEAEAEAEADADADAEHLRLLSIFHFVLAGLHALIGCFPVIHLWIGISILSGEFPLGRGEAPPPAFGWLFVGLASVAILFSWTLAVLMVLAGRRLAARRSRTFCTVVAALECLLMPFGTVLGVFTLVVLARPSVRSRFA